MHKQVSLGIHQTIFDYFGVRVKVETRRIGIEPINFKS